MIIRLAIRTLFAHPMRSAVLAAGFGLGVAVMAILLGVGQVVLQQARAPELVGGGDVIVTGATGDVTAARVLLAGVLKTAALAARTRVASPSSRASLYILSSTANSQHPTPNSQRPASKPNASPAVPLLVRARGGIPSLERALNDPETAAEPEWRDAAPDAAWTSPDPGDVLRAIDRFHTIPDVPARAETWAEWLYFNGQSGDIRFYLTFIIGPLRQDGRRGASVRLQLERGGMVTSFSASDALDDTAIARAPDLSIANNHVRVQGLRYRITLDLRDASGRAAAGELFLESAPGRLLPPIEIHGAAGWRSGYVVPVMSGTLGGSLVVGDTRLDLTGGTGYHDHNWGFWEGVTWQWGQVQHRDVSFVFGRVFPPRDAADPERMPGFLGALGPDGPIGYAANATIEERSDATGQPRELVVRGRSVSMDLTMTFAVERSVVNRLSSGPLARGLDFLQMRGHYQVRGRVGQRDISFTAPGAAETFRGTSP